MPQRRHRARKEKRSEQEQDAVDPVVMAVVHAGKRDVRRVRLRSGTAGRAAARRRGRSRAPQRATAARGRPRRPRRRSAPSRRAAAGSTGRRRATRAPSARARSARLRHKARSPAARRDPPRRRRRARRPPRRGSQRRSPRPTVQRAVARSATNASTRDRDERDREVREDERAAQAADKPAAGHVVELPHREARVGDDDLGRDDEERKPHRRDLERQRSRVRAFAGQAAMLVLGPVVLQIGRSAHGLSGPYPAESAYDASSRPRRRPARRARRHSRRAHRDGGAGTPDAGHRRRLRPRRRHAHARRTDVACGCCRSTRRSSAPASATRARRERRCSRLAPVGARIVLEADPASTASTATAGCFATSTARGTNVNLELVREGAAAPYFYGGERGSLRGGAAGRGTSRRRRRSAGSGRRALDGPRPDDTRSRPGEAARRGRRRRRPASATRTTPAAACRPTRPTSTAPTSARSASRRSASSAPTRTGSTATATAGAASNGGYNVVSPT